VAHLLLEYLKIADLIRHRIVVPVSGEGFGPRSPRGSLSDSYSNSLLSDDAIRRLTSIPRSRKHAKDEDFIMHLIGSTIKEHDTKFSLSDDEIREVIDVLTSIPRFKQEARDVDLIQVLGWTIKEQLWLNQRTENRMDLYFPQDSYVPVLQGLLRAASYRYTSKEIYEPFEVGVFADLANLDTSQISITDIIAIRSESAFSDYRRVLQGILRRLQDREGKFSDLETEFAVAAREEMAECDDKIKQLTKRSNVLKGTLNNLDRVLIGGAAGAVGGLLAGSPKIAVLGSAAGAAVRPLYDILRGAWTASPNSAARASFRHHFLALNSRDSESRQ
jgi:hypothetical protein